VTIYVEKIAERVLGRKLERVQLLNPFLLRSVGTPPSALAGRTVVDVSRYGKRIVLKFGEPGPLLAIHLMISGRFLWSEPEKKPIAGKIVHGHFIFESGTLTLTEASSKKRATLHVLDDEDQLIPLQALGVEPLTASPQELRATLTKENRTLKRALTMASHFSGIGNAYSDEILFHAKLSPVRLTQSLSPEELDRLVEAIPATLKAATDHLREHFSGRFPGKGEVTAFRPEFAVHGKFGQPCPVCGHPVQQIVYAENQTNYCASCQNEGRLLADRSLSRLLKQDWPKTLEQMVGDG